MAPTSAAAGFSQFSVPWCATAACALKTLTKGLLAIAAAVRIKRKTVREMMGTKKAARRRRRSRRRRKRRAARRSSDFRVLCPHVALVVCGARPRAQRGRQIFTSSLLSGITVPPTGCLCQGSRLSDARVRARNPGNGMEPSSIRRTAVEPMPAEYKERAPLDSLAPALAAVARGDSMEDARLSCLLSRPAFAFARHQPHR